MARIFQERSNNDRRKADFGPPKGWKDRRRAVERRMPEVTELSFEDCAALMGRLNPLAKENPFLAAPAAPQLDPFASTTKNDP